MSHTFSMFEKQISEIGLSVCPSIMNRYGTDIQTNQNYRRFFMRKLKNRTVLYIESGGKMVYKHGLLN